MAVGIRGKRLLRPFHPSAVTPVVSARDRILVLQFQPSAADARLVQLGEQSLDRARFRHELPRAFPLRWAAAFSAASLHYLYRRSSARFLLEPFDGVPYPFGFPRMVRGPIEPFGLDDNLLRYRRACFGVDASLEPSHPAAEFAILGHVPRPSRRFTEFPRAAVQSPEFPKEINDSRPLYLFSYFF